MNEQSIYVIRKENVKKSLELFTKTRKYTKRKILEKYSEKCIKYLQYCNPIFYNKKLITSAFSSISALTEMRLCLMKHDWNNLQKLFSILLNFSNKKEILIWRYALTILLHSPMSNGVHFEEFFDLCVGCQNDNYNNILNQLVTLNN